MRRGALGIAILCAMIAAGLPAFAFGSRESDRKEIERKENESASSVETTAPAPGTGAPAQVGPDWNAVREGDRVELAGKIRLVGSEAASNLVLTDAAGKDWYVDGPERGVLAGKEQRDVRLSAVVRLDMVKFANGKRLEDKRVLTGIRVLE